VHPATVGAIYFQRRFPGCAQTLHIGFNAGRRLLIGFGANEKKWGHSAVLWRFPLFCLFNMEHFWNFTSEKFKLRHYPLTTGDCTRAAPASTAYCPHSTRGAMAPFKPKPRQPPMTKVELRAQGIQALAQVTTPIIKLPMKIRRQCGRCGDFNSVLVEPGQAVPAFKCSACGYPAG
jgi:hypothetical protein